MANKWIVNPENPNGVLVECTEQENTEYNNGIEEAATALAQLKADEQAKADLKASAKAKLIAGEPLTEEEADTIVL